MSGDRHSRGVGRDLAIAFLGASIGVLLAVGLGLGFDWTAEGWIYKFQTLITGGIAILAAFIGAFFVQKQVVLARAQVVLTREQEEERLARAFDASWGLLPHTLSAVYVYCEECLAYYQALIAAQQRGEGEGGGADLRLPVLASEAIPQLRDAVAASPREVRPFLRLFLRELQVQATRVAGFGPRGTMRPSGRTTVENFMARVAAVYALCDAFLGYADWEVATPDMRVSPERIRQLLARRSVTPEHYPTAHRDAEAISKSLARDFDGEGGRLRSQKP
jgi:hypothetical protein